MLVAVIADEGQPAEAELRQYPAAVITRRISRAEMDPPAAPYAANGIYLIQRLATHVAYVVHINTSTFRP